MSAHKAVDLTGVTCTECRKRDGVAKVCFKPPKRYFWGCARYPACKGPRAWQAMDVPQAQRDECDAAFEASKANSGAEETSAKKKRSSAKAIPGSTSITKRVLQDTNIKSESSGVKRVSFLWDRCNFRLTFSRSALNENRGPDVWLADGIGCLCTWHAHWWQNADLWSRSARIGRAFPRKRGIFCEGEACQKVTTFSIAPPPGSSNPKARNSKASHVLGKSQNFSGHSL